MEPRPLGPHQVGSHACFLHPAGPGAHGCLPGGRMPHAAREAATAGRAPQQVPHPPGRPHGAMVPPQGAAGLLPALPARQVPAGPVRSQGQGSGGGHPRTTPRPIPRASCWPAATFHGQISHFNRIACVICGFPRSCPLLLVPSE